MLRKLLLVLAFVLTPHIALGQVMNWGDFNDTNQTIYLYFNTVDQDGTTGSITGGAIEIYEDGSDTQITTAETFTANFDSITGLNQVAVDLSDAGFEANKQYLVVLSAGTVDSVSVAGRITGMFTVNRFATPSEVVQQFDVDTFAEPTGVPPATASLADKISYLYNYLLRNKVTATASKKQYYNDGDTVEFEKDLTDDNTTYTETEVNAP